MRVLDTNLTMKKTYLIVSLCFALSCTLHANATDTGLNNDEAYRAIDVFIQAGFACHPNNPGLSLSVVHKGNVVISKGYGVKSVDRDEPVTNETLFGIASLSKAFAATLILKLIEEHEHLNLTTKVKDILYNDAIFYDSLRSDYATLEDLLTHRMGIPNNNDIRLDDTLTRENLVRRLKYLKPIGDFRSSFHYNNLMYGLVTYIAEVIGEKSWEELVQEKLLDPLSMTSTAFDTIADESQLDMATGYEPDEGKLFAVQYEYSKHWGILCGSGCILSSSNDMIHWMKFHLAQSRNPGADVVMTSDIMKNAYVNKNSFHVSYAEEYYARPTIPVTVALNNYGLAWRLGYYNGYRIIQHSGSTWGYRSRLVLVPDLQIGVFITMTGDDPNYMFRTNIQSYIIDLLSGNQPWLNTTTICSFPEPWKKKPAAKSKDYQTGNQPSRNVTLCTGSYKNEAYGLMNVYINSTTGQLMIREGVGQYVLHAQRDTDVFYGEGVGLVYKVKEIKELKFLFQNDGSHAYAVHVPGFNPDFPPIFERRVGGNSSGKATIYQGSVLLIWIILTVYHFM